MAMHVTYGERGRHHGEGTEYTGMVLGTRYRYLPGTGYRYPGPERTKACAYLGGSLPWHSVRDSASELKWRRNNNRNIGTRLQRAT